MWALRILNGPQAGQVYPLREGKTALGRSPNCEIKLNSNGISKEHAAILVTNGKLILTDSDSRNGTFVNGVRIQNHRLETSDKIGFHDVLVDLIQVPDGTRSNAQAPAWAGNAAVRLQQQQYEQYQYQQQQLNHHQNPQMQQAHLQQEHAQAAHQSFPQEDVGAHLGHAPAHGTAPAAQMSAGSLSDLANNLKIYIDNVAMPGVYHLAKTLPFRGAIALMVGLFILTTTLLSSIPMINVTRAGIRQESVRRAKTIARNMAANNRQAVIEKNELGVNVKSAELEEGVTDALIISAKEGTIIAPASKRGEFANKPFVNQARREERETDAFISDSQLGVAVPITYYNPDLGSQSIIAYSIVLYDMGSLAMNPAQTLSLIIENLLIAGLAGGVLYCFLYKVIEQPIIALNSQLDDALREGRDEINTDFRYPIIETLASNISSALTRIRSGGDANLHMVVNREIEASNVLRMLPIAGITVNASDERIIATNDYFDRLVGGASKLQGRPLTDIPDSSLQQQLRELLPKMRENTAELAISSLQFPDGKYEICGQSIFGSNEPSYYLITLYRLEMEG